MGFNCRIQSEVEYVIRQAVLYDIRSYKTLVSHSFHVEPTDDTDLENIANAFFETLGDAISDSCIEIEHNQESVLICRVEEFVILVCYPEDGYLEENKQLANNLASTYRERVEKMGQRPARELFTHLVERELRKRRKICFIYTSKSLQSIKSINRLCDNLDAFNVGPYSTFFIRAPYSDISHAEDVLKSSDIVVMVISSEIASNLLIQAIEFLRKNSISMIVVLPETDEDLELAREYEMNYDLILCDSVEVSPSYLTLSILAVTGHIDMHPELAEKRLKIDGLSKTPTSIESSSSGLQAFFVIDKYLGEPRYSFYYHEKSKILERAPNLLAAISMFKIEPLGSDETSVVQTGELKYAVIEKENLLFTMVTGTDEDIEQIREKFGSLPALYLEDPPNQLMDSEDLYNSPAFTLKLLATFPPKFWPKHYTPIKQSEPEWARFSIPLVREFMHTVWNTIEEKTRLDNLIEGESSGLLLGALHLLELLGYITVSLVLEKNDIPIRLRELTNELKRIYSGLDELFELIDGNQSIDQIAYKASIDLSVVIMVLTELLRQNIISIRE